MDVSRWQDANVTIEMPESGVYLNGVNQVRAIFTKAPQAITEQLKIGMTQALALLHDAIAEYPPETQANRPPGPMVTRRWTLKDGTVKTKQAPAGRWYERGTGTRYMSGHVDATSEQLGRSWTETLNVTATEWEGVLGNKASYGPYVQDAEHQAWFHKARGWKTVQSVAAEYRTRVITVLQRALDRALNAGGQ